MTTRTKKLLYTAAGGLLLGALFSCASPTTIVEGAQRDEARATTLEAQGDYYGAARAREAAARERVKAADRASWYY